MKMTLQRAKNLVYVKQHYDSSSDDKVYFRNIGWTIKKCSIKVQKKCTKK